ncbi:MAG: membrane-bound lytic murein transglycosylase MltF [Xanthomonadales bacterium]|nr:membrane-bound lytic murein transglycosylase MltF [Xanthomonadales bacterium]
MAVTATQNRETIWTGGFIAIGLVLLLSLLVQPSLDTTAPSLSHIHQVLQRGTLRVVTVNSPVTYYQEHEQYAGFEFELASQFASYLGVSAEFQAVASFAELFDAVSSGQADLAAASVTVTEGRRQQLRFGRPYLEATQFVVYRAGSSKPRSLTDLVGRDIAVVRASSYAETLDQLGRNLAGLHWQETEGDIEQLFYAVEQGELDLTVADSTVLDIHQRFFPNLRRAIALTESQPVAWAFSSNRDNSLQMASEEFIGAAQANGVLDDIKQRYHSHIPYFDQINTHYLLRHINSRLPTLTPLFQEAAEQTGFDWRLLAAIGYQESLWDEQAVSPTGVRGIMMLTNATASMMGVSDRADPRQSILGGAAYLRRVKRKVPVRIQEPDRTWLALAAYNIGFAHLEDARILTQRAGKNPDRWSDVAEHLPLLNQREWYRQTRYGYSRGREAVRYVRNIRSFYDILIWVTSREPRPPSISTAP